ncbi:MAG: DUF1156 domain-containing protein, partial [Planctomycetes bacterium]|nr:DUF1156 domain-containing protein [Planctomycetota bacterium]
KLIEVALPLKAINEASAREKSIRHGHPSTLHLWWARRPLAACRAVLFASLVDDPDSDPAYRRPDGTVDVERAAGKRSKLFDLITELVQWENSNNPRVINQARAEIARCVASRKIELGELAKDTIIFDTNPKRERGKSRVAQKHPKGPVSGDGVTAWEVVLMKALPEVVNAFLAEHAPPVLDPFCGGGSIPLEAQRLGLRAYASDLNPVPVLITKALIEIPPKFAGRPPVNPQWQSEPEARKKATVWQGAQGLAEDVRYYGQWMRDEAEKRIGHLYPKVKITAAMAHDRPDLKQYVDQELTVIAWLWARTVKCPNPACGIDIPLVRSFELSTKSGSHAWASVAIDHHQHPGKLVFEVKTGNGSAQSGTVRNRAVTCPACSSGSTLPYVRDEAQAGRMGAALLAVVAEGRRSRVYLRPTKDVEAIAHSAKPYWKPDQRVTTPCHDVDRLPMYGMFTWGDVFTPRQLLTLATISDLVLEARELVQVRAKLVGTNSTDTRPLAEGGCGAIAYADAVATYLGESASKLTTFHNTLAYWRSKEGKSASGFGRQALAMTWDFTETNPFADAGGSFEEIVCSAAPKVITNALCVDSPGFCYQLDATSAFAPIANPVISTDPPYYDNIGYADLSDYFYVWLRRSLGKVHPSLFSTLLTPKAQELIAAPYRFDGNKERAQSFFEEGLGKAFERMRKGHNSDYPLTVYYAFKQSQSEDDEDNEGAISATVASTGWETMLEGLVKAGLMVDGTWPMRTENKTRILATSGGGTNALASSIVLVCRPRPGDAPLATRKEFMNTLRRELPEALKNLQHGNIAPVDLAQAAIGPGMAVFTRYAKVIESDGSPMTVRTALGIISQVLDEVLAEQEGEFDGDTRWALAWYEQFGMQEGAFGVAETLSKAKNTAINGLVEAGVVKARGGKVQLVSRGDLPEGWDPATGGRHAPQQARRDGRNRPRLGLPALLDLRTQQVGGRGPGVQRASHRLARAYEARPQHRGT